MLKLTKLDGTPIAVNLDTVKYCESIPDTLILFINGDSLIVRESLDSIITQTLQYKVHVLEALKAASLREERLPT